MNQEHENAGDIFKEIAVLTANFTPPESACNIYKPLYAKLEEFQNDLFQHTHLENNILFLKAILLEEEVFLCHVI
jgi:regulator of cell morphogenesis and NO signaling